MHVSQNKNHIYGVFFVLLCALPARADNEDAIARCARIATVGDRILCRFGRILGGAGHRRCCDAAIIEPSYGPLGLQLMRAGKDSHQALRALLAVARLDK